MISSRLHRCTAIRAWATMSCVCTLSWCSNVLAEIELVQGVELSLVRGEGADGCITADLVEDEVRERLGRDPFTRPVRQHIECQVTREGANFVARLRERDISGRQIGDRALTATTSNCRDLDNALALAVALIIDPEFLMGGSPAHTDADSPTATQAVRKERVSEAGAGAVRIESTVNLLPATGVVETVDLTSMGDTRVMLGVGVSYGLLPGAGPDFYISVQRRLRGNWHGHLAVLYAPERQLDDVQPTVGLGLTAARLAGCFEGNEALALFGCGGLGAGVIHAVVHGPEPIHPGDRAWAAFSAEFGVRSAFGPVAVELRGQATVPLLHWNFDLLSGKGIFRQAWVVPGVALFLGTHFP